MIRQPRLIFDFTWSGLNDISKCLSPIGAIHFGDASQRTLGQVLTANPLLGPINPSKVYLEDTYMRLWVSMEDVPSVAFLVPNKNISDTQLVGFHLSLPMGYVDNAPYFFMATETVSDLANDGISQRDQAREQPLEMADEARAADDSGL